METIIEKLKSEERQLIDKLTRENKEDIYPKLDAINKEITKQKRLALLDKVNARQTRLRELARQAWEAETPTNDITTNDGSFHATKVKKYPKLSALKYAYAKFQDGLMTELRINGEKFNMYAVKYEYSKPNEYTRPKTFDEFLQLNHIMAKDMTLPEFEALIEANKKINETLESAIKAASAAREKLNMYSLSAWGLFNQRTEHVHPFEPNS